MAGDLNWNYWCPCQIDMEASPITFPPDSDDANDRVARIMADEASLGGNKCRNRAPKFECRPPKSSSEPASDVADRFDDAPDLAESLGPSLIRPPSMAPERRNPHCADEVELRAHRHHEDDECIQRQELRLQTRHIHNATAPHLYSFRFRMPAEIEDRRNSIRWVTVQWKQEPISEAYERQFGDEWGPSPFLAQRFDDGVLHVTVQDEHCRCKVASAPYPDGSIPAWAPGRAQYCESTKPGEVGLACTPELYVQYDPNPILSSALGQ
jgi:hypothetical protein